MMKASYNFDYDARRRLLKLTLSGLWDHATLAAFQREAGALLSRVENAGHTDLGGRILIDLTDFAVQSQDIADGVSALIPTYAIRAGRIAVIRSQSALQKMQMRRLLSSAKLCFVTSEAEGLAWLFEELSAAAN